MFGQDTSATSATYSNIYQLSSVYVGIYIIFLLTTRTPPISVARSISVRHAENLCICKQTVSALDFKIAVGRPKHAPGCWGVARCQTGSVYLTAFQRETRSLLFHTIKLNVVYGAHTNAELRLGEVCTLEAALTIE